MPRRGDPHAVIDPDAGLTFGRDLRARRAACVAHHLDTAAVELFPDLRAQPVTVEHGDNIVFVEARLTGQPGLATTLELRRPR